MAATRRKIESTGEVHFYCDQHAPTSSVALSGGTSGTKSTTKIYASMLALGVIIIVIGVALGVSRMMPSDQPAPAVSTGTTTATTATTTPIGTTGAGNKFFSLVDTYTQDKDMGTPQVIKIVPELDLVGFMYGTSQESTQFGVYNYGTNELFTGIGANNYIESQRIVALLSNDRLVLWSSPGVDALPGARPKLVVINYKTKEVLNTVSIPNNAPKYFHESYNFNGAKNAGFLILKNTFDHGDNTIYQTWELNLDTYQLRKTESLG